MPCGSPARERARGRRSSLPHRLLRHGRDSRSSSPALLPPVGRAALRCTRRGTPSRATSCSHARAAAYTGTASCAGPRASPGRRAGILSVFLSLCASAHSGSSARERRDLAVPPVGAQEVDARLRGRLITPGRSRAPPTTPTPGFRRRPGSGGGRTARRAHLHAWRVLRLRLRARGRRDLAAPPREKLAAQSLPQRYVVVNAEQRPQLLQARRASTSASPPSTPYVVYYAAVNDDERPPRARRDLDHAGHAHRLASAYLRKTRGTRTSTRGACSA
jgi:hypothetical protein